MIPQIAGGALEYQFLYCTREACVLILEIIKPPWE